MDKASALRMPSPVWINIAPEKSFQSIRSLSTQSSSQSHTRLIPFLTFSPTRNDSKMCLLCPTRGFHDIVYLVILHRTSIGMPHGSSYGVLLKKGDRALWHSTPFLIIFLVAEVVSIFLVVRFLRASKH